MICYFYYLAIVLGIVAVTIAFLELLKKPKREHYDHLADFWKKQHDRVFMDFLEKDVELFQKELDLIDLKQENERLKKELAERDAECQGYLDEAVEIAEERNALREEV